MNSKKRTIDSFFKPKEAQNSVKKSRIAELTSTSTDSPSVHEGYPFPVPTLPVEVESELPSIPSSVGRPINDKPHLDLLYFEPFFPKESARLLFEFLRSQLFWYRVEYSAKKFGKELKIKTPRWTTVFGIDHTSTFDQHGNILDRSTGRKCPADRYPTCHPRPIPDCLDKIRKATELATGEAFNVCLVNYYASGEDSISYHSDDEKFLGSCPAIASFSFGGQRDFLMKHKSGSGENEKAEGPMKFSLKSGDMMLMRGETQSKWMHSIPKRSGGSADRGRINITFRKAMVRGGTENYYHYNVGQGPVFKWHFESRRMREWKVESDKA